MGSATVGPAMASSGAAQMAVESRRTDDAVMACMIELGAWLPLADDSGEGAIWGLYPKSAKAEAGGAGSLN